MNMREATDAQRLAARQKLGEVEVDEAKRTAAIQTLGEAAVLAAIEPPQEDVARELKGVASNSRLLLRFLRHKKYDQNLALQSLISHFRYMRAAYEVPDDQTAPTHYPLADAAPLIELGLFVVAPGRDSDGRVVVVCSDISLAQKMMQENSRDTVSKAFSMFFWELGQSDDAQLLGISFVQDMSTYSMLQMRSGMSQQKSMSAKQKKAAPMSADAMPLKYGKFFIVDAPWYFGLVWAIIKNFMKKKLVERIQFIKRNDLSKLHDNLPLDSLPPSMGGSLDVRPTDKWWWVEPERRPAAGRAQPVDGEPTAAASRDLWL